MRIRVRARKAKIITGEVYKKQKRLTYRRLGIKSPRRLPE